MSNNDANGMNSDIAVVGMVCRFPGAQNISQFWENLKGGVESITFYSDEELEEAGNDPALLSNPYYVKAASSLEGVDQFDAAFFGIHPREAEVMDPHQRILIECAWECLETAGYDPETYKGYIGIYAGAGINRYWTNNLASNRDLLARLIHLQLITTNEKDYLTTRISYKLNLRGPSVN